MKLMPSPRYLPCPVLVPSDREGEGQGVLVATLLLATLLHIVAILAWVVLGDAGETDSFFSTSDDVAQVIPITVVPAPTPPRSIRAVSSQPPTRVPAPGRPGVRVPRPVVSPKSGGGGSPRAPVRPPRVVAVPRPAARTVAVSNGSEPAGATGVGQGEGTGAGDGKGPGSGPGNGPGEGGGGTSTRKVYWVIEYDRLGKLGVQATPEQDAQMARIHTWQDACTVFGIDYQNDLMRRPYVEPFFLSSFMPDLKGCSIDGREGLVGLQANVAADGRADVAITASAQDEILDRVGFAIAKNLTWLPALKSGKPVDAQVQIHVRFRSDRSYGRDDAVAQPTVQPSP